VKDLLDAVLELEGLVLAQILDPGAITPEGFVGGQCCLDIGLLDLVQFQREEQQMRARVRHLLLDVAVELGALRIAGIAGIDEAGIGHDAADQFLQRLVGMHHGAQASVARRPCRASDPAFPGVLEGDGVGVRAG